jgi:hypothetical protein
MIADDNDPAEMWLLEFFVAEPQSASHEDRNTVRIDLQANGDAEHPMMPMAL